MRQLSETIEALEKVLSFEGDKHEQAKGEKGQYKYIPFSPSEFCNQMSLVNGYLGHDSVRFVDVGCGIGTKVVLGCLCLKNYSKGESFNGIEITPEYCEVAERLLERNTIPGTIYNQDALKTNYSPWNVIYFYSPLSNVELEKRLEARILKTALPGTVIVGNLRKTDNRVWEKHCLRLNNCVHVKK